MIKKLLLVLLAFTGGIIAYFTIVQGIPVTVLTGNFTTFITSRLEPVTTFLANNKYTSLIGAGGITLIGILIKQFQNMKAKATTAFEEATAWKGEALQINAVTDNLREQLKEKQTEVNTLKQQVNNLPQNYTQLLSEKDKKIIQLEKDVQDLKNEYDLLKKVAEPQSAT